jgi:hypothetical protein
MASLFAPDVPQQDPAVAKQQKDEQARAEAANTRATQTQLTVETNLRAACTRGARSLLGSFDGFGGTLGSG